MKTKNTKNCYIIIGIFALFRIALILINTIIDPEKFSDKNYQLNSSKGEPPSDELPPLPFDEP